MANRVAKMILDASGYFEVEWRQPRDTEPAPHAANDAPISTLDISGCMDSNNMTHVADSRKISAFMSIKNGGKFLVYPSGSTPMREWVSPDTFAALLPDLFPYGCGVFEDPLRPKKVPFAAHVKHLLKLKDRRFATHTTFPFICLNMSGPEGDGTLERWRELYGAVFYEG
ncbi:hypothetical protein B9479_008358 [Cryptococcus floricola]|uniref:Uncharacterized protein n=1 Tax=Cryptococcus floricola TaxID=2591691 RepID=A0A5D3AL17_9TREE|nr:hypothetical protein B9479_008358 [Cryptococcus floricola]